MESQLLSQICCSQVLPLAEGRADQGTHLLSHTHRTLRLWSAVAAYFLGSDPALLPVFLT